MKKTKAPPKRGATPLDVSSFQQMAEELSLSISESEHIETIEEANDFNIPDDDSEDFLQNITVYEMHEMAEENLSLYNQALAESNETGAGAQDQTTHHLHDQSAPSEPNSLDPNPTSPLSTEGASPTNERQRVVSEAQQPAPPPGTK